MPRPVPEEECRRGGRAGSAQFLGGGEARRQLRTVDGDEAEPGEPAVCGLGEQCHGLPGGTSLNARSTSRAPVPEPRSASSMATERKQEGGGVALAVSLEGGGADDAVAARGDEHGVGVGQPVERETGGIDQPTDAGPVAGSGAPDGDVAGLRRPSAAGLGGRRGAGVVGDGGAAAGRAVRGRLGEGRAVGEDGVDLPALAVGRALDPELVLLGVAAGGAALVDRGEAGRGEPGLLGVDRRRRRRPRRRGG